jgi:diguanylate cyclase (GGDEF) domain
MWAGVQTGQRGASTIQLRRCGAVEGDGMLGKRDDMDRWDELFAVVENRLHADDRRLRAPTALLRLKRAIEAAANAKVCLSALQDLRAAMSREVAARRDLSRRCNVLEAALRELQRDSKDPGSRVEIPTVLEPIGREPASDQTSFNERLAHVFGTRTSTSIAVMRIGFGSFEEIAVELGSRVVTRLLKVASSRIAHAVRSGDIVSGIDSEGFACVLLELPSRERLTHLACKMIDLLSEPVPLAERQIALSPTVGIAMFPGDGTTPDELIATAAAAMRRARDQESRYAFSDARAEIWASQFSNLSDE